MRFFTLALCASLLTACAGTDGADLDDEISEESPEPEEDEESADTVTSALSSGVRFETHFTKAKDENGGESDMEILNHVVRLIDATPEGESIDAAIHSISVPKVIEALARAKKERKVKVRVVHDGHNREQKELAELLGASHRFCGQGDVAGCISNAKSSIMHTKLFLFSKTKDETNAMRSNVTWFGSANMTFKTGANTFNNTVTVYGDKSLYTKMENGYFDRLWNETHFRRNDFQGVFDSKDSKTIVFASPSQDTDIIRARLRQIHPGRGCRIRVAQSMMFDSRTNLIDELDRLKDGGCKVWVVGNTVQPEAKAALKKARIPSHTAETHDKNILVFAKFGCGNDCNDAKRKKIVFTGSHNWTKSANETNDELFVRIDNPRVYDAFVRHFNRAYNGSPKL